MVEQYRGVTGALRLDPIHTLSAVATGIGFLGAGVIFQACRGERVQGLTTAASVWATAAVGIAAGIRRYVLAVGATLLLLGVLRVLALLERKDQP